MQLSDLEKFNGRLLSRLRIKPNIVVIFLLFRHLHPIIFSQHLTLNIVLSPYFTDIVETITILLLFRIIINKNFFTSFNIIKRDSTGLSLLDTIGQFDIFYN